MLEVVKIEKHTNGHHDLTTEELDQWVETFPVHDLRWKNAARLT
jgi:hypothetical protein